MPINLDDTLAWTKASFEEQAMLADLQGNILKGHGRHATLNLFLRLDGSIEQSRDLVHAVGGMTTRADAQLDAAAAHRADPDTDTPPFVTLMLSHPAYRKLGRENWAPQDGGAFEAGMAARDLGDGAPDDAFRERADLLVIVAADPTSATSWESEAVHEVEQKLLPLFATANATVLMRQPGRAIFRRDGGPREEGIEHFGYVDGRSQPLFLKEDVLREAEATDGANVWNPEFPLGQVLVSDPAAQSDAAFGSFFVFRKLEQDVVSFKSAEKTLGENLNTAAANKGLPPEDEDFAGASLVGRFEDGTPVVAQRSPGADDPVQNNFTYDGDPDGLRCPLHAHIRKTNPRTDETRAVLMARRGITYGKRDSIVDPDGLAGEPVGLLFMAYQADIAAQFEVTQRHWANAPSFPQGGTGIDPVIGQPGQFTEGHNIRWGDRVAGRRPGPFGGHVTFRGGDYFFAPARSTLLGM